MAPLTATAEAPSLSPSIEDRAVRATLACVARHGLAKTTFDDVAREAGCARATLYRYFGGKRPPSRTQWWRWSSAPPGS
jgi:AcrR family transcriptional regulator